MLRRVVPLLVVVLLTSSCGWFQRRHPSEPGKFEVDLDDKPKAELIEETPEKPVTVPEGVKGPRSAAPVTPPTVPAPVRRPEPAPVEKPRIEKEEPLRPALAKATYEPDAAIVGTVVAVVNGDIITKEEVLEEIRPQLDAIDADASLTAVGRETKRRELISTVLVMKVERLLALQQARRTITAEEGQQIQASVDSLVKDTIRAIGTATRLEGELARHGQTIDKQKQTEIDNRRIQTLLEREVDSHVTVTPADMSQYYEAHRTDYEHRAQVQIRQIFLDRKNYASTVEAEAKATDLLKRIRKGEDFGKLAKQYSDCPYAQNEGLWEFVTEGSGAFRPEVERVAFRLAPKEVSGVITSEIGVHLIKAEDVRPARTVPFAEVQAEIGAKLRREQRERLYREFIRKLWDKSYVDIRWR